MKRIKAALVLSLCASLCVGMLTGCMSGNNTTSSSEPMLSSSMPTPTPSMSPSPSPSPSISPSPSTSSLEEDNMLSGNQPTAAAGSADFSQIGALDGTSVQWGPGTQFDAENRPTAPVALQKKYASYDCMFIGESTTKTVYLTFDQGYENGYTTKILDTLKEKNVPAVFFLTGHYINTSADLVQRMVDEGHVLGNHSNRHFDVTEVPLATAQEDFITLNEMVKNQFDYDCKLYRFPEGKFSEQGLALVEQNNCRSIFWSFAYNDWNADAQPDPAQSLQKLTSRLHNGAIYLLHSVSATNAQILGDFIDNARSQGYEFAKIEA